MGRKDNLRNEKGQFLPKENISEFDKAIKAIAIQKGVGDSSFGQQPAMNAVAPKAIRNSAQALTPVEAYELSSPVRTAIRARNEPFQQMKIRLFDRNENEIVSGEVYEFCQHPNPFQSGSDFITNLSCWADLADERSVWFHPNKLTGKMNAHVLNPMQMLVTRPYYAKLPEDILVWQYFWSNGTTQNFLSEEICYDHEFNPSSPVRGASKLYAVINAIDANYRAERYIRYFFLNNAVPSTIVNIDTQNPDLVNPLKRELESDLRGEANAFKLLFTYGAKVTLNQLEQPMQDAPFLLLKQDVKKQVAGLYMTPPLVTGDFDSVRFDSAQEQSDYFYGGIFLPNNEKNQRFMQKLIEKTFPVTLPSKYHKIKTKMKPSLRLKYEKSKSEAQGDVVVVFDCDNIPEVARLKIHRIELAEKYQRVFHITPAASALEVGLDLDLNPASDMVWYNSDQKFVEHIKGDTVPITPLSTSTGDNITPMPQLPSPETDAEAENEEIDSEAVENVKQFYRKLRILTMECLDTKKIWKLSTIDNLAKQYKCMSPEAFVEIRKDFSILIELVKSGSKDNIKKHFNSKKNSFYRQLAKGIK